MTFLIVMGHHFRGMWGSEGTRDGEFSNPWGIAVDLHGNVYVANRDNHRVQKFSSAGTFLDKWGQEANGEGEFLLPQYLTIDSRNNIYVTQLLGGVFHEPPRTRIQKFSQSGDFIKQWGDAGFNNGQFKGPLGITAKSDDEILVVDSMNFRIQKFTSEGNFITRWGRYEPGDDRHWHLGAPTGIVVDTRDDNYITDVQHNCVRKFDRASNFIKQWRSFGSGQGQFNNPNGMATFTGDSILVVDTGNHRIQEFSRDGVFITSWGMIWGPTK